MSTGSYVRTLYTQMWSWLLLIFSIDIFHLLKQKKSKHFGGFVVFPFVIFNSSCCSWFFVAHFHVNIENGARITFECSCKILFINFPISQYKKKYRACLPFLSSSNWLSIFDFNFVMLLFWERYIDESSNCAHISQIHLSASKYNHRLKIHGVLNKMAERWSALWLDTMRLELWVTFHTYHRGFSIFLYINTCATHVVCVRALIQLVRFVQ